MSLKDKPGRLQLERYPLRLTTRVLYADMDAFRHVNNGATGRSTLNMQVFGASVMIHPSGGLQLLFANIIVDFLAQAHYPGEVEIASGISRIGNSSWTISQAAFQNGHCFALSDGILVKAVDGKPVALTQEERGAMTNLLLLAD
jgi:acyl-CoA thioester hydrolase